MLRLPCQTPETISSASSSSASSSSTSNNNYKKKKQKPSSKKKPFKPTKQNNNNNNKQNNNKRNKNSSSQNNHHLSENFKSQIPLPRPSPSSDQELASLYDSITTFLSSSSSSTASFVCPVSLSKSQRAVVHEWADAVGLMHYSSGFKSNRQLILEKPDCSGSGVGYTRPAEWRWAGYIGLFGGRIDAAARGSKEEDGGNTEDMNDSLQMVPLAYRERRERRDGPVHHITLLNKKEVRHMIRREDNSYNSGMDLLQKVSDTVIDDWEDLGLGRVQQGSNETWFRVLRWPSADRFLSQELPEIGKRDWHITIGFKEQDIHGVHKGVHSLVYPTALGQHYLNSQEPISHDSDQGSPPPLNVT